MDPVFDAQYLRMKDEFNSAGIDIAVAYAPDGEADYVYATGLLLAADRGDNIRRLQQVLPPLRRTHADERRVYGDLVLLSIDDSSEHGRLTVPQALDIIDERLGKEFSEEEGPPAAPVHIVHTSKLCAATEPEVPCGCDPQPCPGVAVSDARQEGIRLVVSDTGLWEQPDPGLLHSWMVGVDGETEPPGPTLSGGQLTIPYDAGHGTFVAGVARCMAPGAAVYVGRHFPYSGGALEHVLALELENLIKQQSPDLINLSAGAYTRKNVPPLAFSEFRTRNPGITLVAAAGNDSTDRPFWPAAFPWTVSVGALGGDQQNLAWFSNHGPWVDVYALGEGLVNAFATGLYTYQEPPKRPTKQVFDGMARWDGTSFSAPLVAGLIVAEMARSSTSAAVAAQAVLAAGRQISGVGLAVFPPP